MASQLMTSLKDKFGFWPASAPKPEDIGMIKVPKDLQRYLVTDEIIQQHFKFTDKTAYASTKRLCVKQGNTIRDIDYAHVSSIAYQVEHIWQVVLIGAILVATGYLLKGYIDLWWAVLGTGIAFMAAGALWKNRQIELCVSGLPVPVRLSGNRNSLDSLFKLIREHRSQ